MQLPVWSTGNSFIVVTCSRYKSQAPLPVAHWVRITRFSNCCVCARITPCQTYAKSDPGQLSSCLCQGFGLNKSGEGAMYFSTLCNHLRPATLVCRLHFKWHPPESFGWQTWGGGWVVPWSRWMGEVIAGGERVQQHMKPWNQTNWGMDSPMHLASLHLSTFKSKGIRMCLAGGKTCLFPYLPLCPACLRYKWRSSQSPLTVS